MGGSVIFGTYHHSAFALRSQVKPVSYISCFGDLNACHTVSFFTFLSMSPFHKKDRYYKVENLHAILFYGCKTLPVIPSLRFTKRMHPCPLLSLRKTCKLFCFKGIFQVNLGTFLCFYYTNFWMGVEL